uniref:Uncharacterized protein n=1 Tax=Arundo donax TaxID=35708 RepID=A0A0A9HH82_ARUDO
MSSTSHDSGASTMTLGQSQNNLNMSTELNKNDYDVLVIGT